MIEVDAAAVLAVAIEKRHQKVAGLQEEFQNLNEALPLKWRVREKIREVQGMAEKLDDALFELAQRIVVSTEPDFVGRVWELDTPDDIESPLGTAIELAWGIIANAYGGDWENASEDWRGAAERWRNEYVG